MIIRIDPSGAPPYVQISDQLATMIRAGTLPSGGRLPAIRHLANDLGVAVNTVGRAYQELEASGLVVAGGRRGTTVQALDATAPEQAAELAETADRLALEARHRGVRLEDAVEQVRAAFRRLDLEGS